MAILYVSPRHWIHYDPVKIIPFLVQAKVAMTALITTPYQRDWVETLERVQLKMEVAGTSQIEGAEFTPKELEVALDPGSNPQELNRSQRQARAADETYRWIRQLPTDLPVNEDVVIEVHRRIVTGCDDDHCEPGRLRGRDQNVTFGDPRHRGCEGGPACAEALSSLVHAFRHEFPAHDRLVQALAFHYHFAAIHPFLDGNGRVARAMEALLLQRAGLKDIAFIPMSNYYYDEKPQYLKTLADARATGHDLTAFLIFGLRGIAIQCQRVLDEIRTHMAKVLFRSMANQLFGKLKSTRKRVIQERQRKIINLLLDRNEMDWGDLRRQMISAYNDRQRPDQALVRDVNELASLEAISITRTGKREYRIAIRLDWPARITETEFFRRVKEMPKARTYGLLTE